MPEQKFIHIRYPDGREQRLVKNAAGERVAAREESRGAKRFEPDAPYTAEDAEDAEKAAKAQKKEQAASRASRSTKPAAGAAKDAVSGTEKTAEAKAS